MIMPVLVCRVVRVLVIMRVPVPVLVLVRVRMIMRVRVIMRVPVRMIMPVLVCMIMPVRMVVPVIVPVSHISPAPFAGRLRCAALPRSRSSRAHSFGNMRCTTIAAPKPLSMLTTATPEAHDVSMEKSAVKPLSAAP